MSTFRSSTLNRSIQIKDLPRDLDELLDSKNEQQCLTNVIKLTNQGAQSTVYEATLAHRNCPMCRMSNNVDRVIIKTEQSNSRTKESKLVKELDIYKQLMPLNLPNIPELFECLSSVDQNFKYLTIRKMDTTLKDIMHIVETWPITSRIRFALQIAQCILATLQTIHMVKNIVHYDIKPGNIAFDVPEVGSQLDENILNNKCRNAFLIDFGLAGKNGTRIDSMAGSPAYMSLAHAQGVIHYSADIQSLGHVLIHIITGSPLHEQLLMHQQKDVDLFEGVPTSIKSPPIYTTKSRSNVRQHIYDDSASSMYGIQKSTKNSKGGARASGKVKWITRAGSFTDFMQVFGLRISEQYINACEQLLDEMLPNESNTNLLMRSVKEFLLQMISFDDNNIDKVANMKVDSASYRTLYDKIRECTNYLEMQGGSYAKFTYKGRSYKIHNGARGGKYIVVGKEKKCIYIKSLKLQI